MHGPRDILRVAAYCLSGKIRIECFCTEQKRERGKNMTYNIAIDGPAGAGKSTIVDILLSG